MCSHPTPVCIPVQPYLFGILYFVWLAVYCLHFSDFALFVSLEWVWFAFFFLAPAHRFDWDANALALSLLDFFRKSMHFCWRTCLYLLIKMYKLCNRLISEKCNSFPISRTAYKICCCSLFLFFFRTLWEFLSLSIHHFHSGKKGLKFTFFQAFSKMLTRINIVNAQLLHSASCIHNKINAFGLLSQ